MDRKALYLLRNRFLLALLLALFLHAAALFLMIFLPPLLWQSPGPTGSIYPEILLQFDESTEKQAPLRKRQGKERKTKTAKTKFVQQQTGQKLSSKKQALTEKTNPQQNKADQIKQADQNEDTNSKRERLKNQQAILHQAESGQKTEEGALLLSSLPASWQGMVLAKPPYPGIARRRGYSGTVQARIHIQADGFISKVEIVKSSGHLVLDHSVVQTIKEKWRFEPLKRKARVEKIFHFILEEG